METGKIIGPRPGPMATNPMTRPRLRTNHLGRMVRESIMPPQICATPPTTPNSR